MRTTTWMRALLVLGVSSAKANFTATEGVKLVSPNPHDFHDFFGRTVSLSADGSKALISASAGGKSEDSGVAYIFSLSEGVWVQETKLEVQEAQGGLVALGADGKRAFVGDSYWSDTSTGAVYVFALDAEGVWSQEAKLVSEHGNRLGGSLFSIGDGTRVLVSTTNSPAKVYLFKLEGGVWLEEAEITANCTEPESLRGTVAVSKDGGWVFVSAMRIIDERSYKQEGSVFVFKREGGTWVEHSRLKGDGLASDMFGRSITLNDDGTRAFISAYRDMEHILHYYDEEDDVYGPLHDRFEKYDKADKMEAVFVFHLVDGKWQKEARLTPSDREVTVAYGFGSRMAITGNGDRALFSGVPNQDAVYIFEIRNGVWLELPKLTTSDESYGRSFGTSLTLSTNGTRAFIGTHLRKEDEPGLILGSVYIWELSPVVSTEHSWQWACDCDLDGGMAIEECRLACREARGQWAWTCDAGAPGIKVYSHDNEIWNDPRAACQI